MEKTENPGFVSENLLMPHTCTGDEKLSLSGMWRFFAQTRELDAPEDWTSPAFNDRKWARIPVPGCWDGQDGTPGPAEPVTGFYRRSFLLTRDQGTRQIILRFELLRSDTRIWVNGQYIGSSSGMEIPVEFDITSAVRPERNVVCVQLFGTDAHGYFPGIAGDVSLYSLPQRIISRLQVNAQWQDEDNAMLHVSLQARNADGFTARIALMDGSQVIGYRECPIRDGSGAAAIPCPGVKLWCANQPVLYRVAVILWDGSSIHHTTQRTVGFRRISFANRGLFINDCPEKLLGTVYLPYQEKNGMPFSTDQVSADLMRIRQSNMNTVLFPCPVSGDILDLCDRMGMYVVFAGGTGSEDQLRRMELLYGDHPSILLWNLPEDHPGILSHRQMPVETIDGPPVDPDRAVFLRYPEIPRDAEEILSQIRKSDFFAGAVFGTFREDQLNQLKYLLRPVDLAYQDQVLTVTNFSLCHSTEAYLARYRLTRDGETIVERDLELILAPGESRSIPLETRYDIYRSGRYYLAVEYLHRDSRMVAAFAQWPVANLRHILDENPGGTIREDCGLLMLKSSGSVYTVSRAFAALDQIALEDSTLLRSPVCPVYCPTWDHAGGFRIPDEWEKLSTGKKKLKPAVLEVDHMTRTLVASYKLGSGLMQTLRLYADGSMAMELRLRTGRTAPAMLGVRFPLKKELGLFRWFGMGPKDGPISNSMDQFVGKHQEPILSGHTTQKEPVYSLTVTDAQGCGLLIRSEEGLRAGYTSDPGGNSLVLALPEQELKPHTTYTLSFTIRPIE